MLPVAVEMLPEGYRRLEYLESTGTQWIQTDIFPQEYLEAEFDSQFTQINGNRQLFGLAASFLYIGIEANGKWQFFVDDADLLRHIFRITIERSTGKKSWFISGVNEYVNNGSTAVDRLLRLIPFSLDSGAFSCHLRCYSAKLYGDGELVCNLIPCLDAKGKPCMFDTVSCKPFYNGGTGQFLYG